MPAFSIAWTFLSKLPWKYIGFGLIVAMAMTPQAPHQEDCNGPHN